MNLENIIFEIIESMAGSIHKGFQGAVSDGYNTINISSYKAMRYAEILEHSFGKSQLTPILAILKNLMVARAIEKDSFTSIYFYLSEQAATLALITSLEILLNSKGWFSFSGRENYRIFEESGYQVSFLGEDYSSWEFSALGADFVSVTYFAEISAQLQHLNSAT